MSEFNRNWHQVTVYCLLAFTGVAYGDATAKKTDRDALPPALAADVDQAIDRGLKFLTSTQDADGGWNDQYGPAITAVVAKAFAQDDDFGSKHPIVRRSTEVVLRYQQQDGGIYERKQNLANYETAVALMFLCSLNQESQRKNIARAQAFLGNLQYDSVESIDTDNAWYGGAGYNEIKRPDLSNTQMMIEALHQSGLSKDHPVYRRSLKFVTRCQLLGSTNDLDFAKGATDGGFVYSPNGNGESKASEELEEGLAPLRSYGSMTYAGFKSMLYANVTRDDPRIKACLAWIQRNYTLDCNPNMPGRQSRQGLFYYYNVFARALSAWGEPVIYDAARRPHNWRIELCAKLLSIQKPDGSWVNDEPRWLEGDSTYITGLTILTLQAATQRSQ